MVQLERLLAARRDEHLEPLVTKDRLENRSLIRLVFHEQHPAMTTRWRAP
jgi:hypothetical protein